MKCTCGYKHGSLWYEEWCPIHDPDYKKETDNVGNWV